MMGAAVESPVKAMKAIMESSAAEAAMESTGMASEAAMEPAGMTSEPAPVKSSAVPAASPKSARFQNPRRSEKRKTHHCGHKNGN